MYYYVQCMKKICYNKLDRNVCDLLAKAVPSMYKLEAQLQPSRKWWWCESLLSETAIVGHH